MSIFSRTGEPAPFDSLTRRLSLFADRDELTRLLLRSVNESPLPGQILFLHGMGGNGKSLLLRYLQARCCVRFRPGQWQEFVGDPSATTFGLLHSAAGADPAGPVANALIDFGARPVGQQRPLEALPGLFILKRQLAHYGVKTPRFDFAAVNYLQKSGLAYKQLLPELFPEAELDLAISIADFLAGLPVVSAGRALLKIIEDRTDGRLTKWRMARAIEKEHVAKILEAPADPVLADLLPYYFATDLNAALTISGQRSRIVLFCDTHEAFWGEDAFPAAGVMSLATLARDKWLRILLGYLNLEAGVIVVVASRKPPRWSQAEEAAIPDDCINLQHIAGLSPADARWYLEQVGITDTDAQRLVISYASGAPDEVHPYMLGLCTDVLASEQSGKLDLAGRDGQVAAGLDVRRRRLVARLMSSVSDDRQRQVVAVAAARSFDYHCFRFLARSLHFDGSLDAYQRLTNFSFMLEASDSGFDAEPTQAAFAVHQLLQRELGAMYPADSLRAHAALADFYRAKPDSASQAEAALHLSYADQAAGIRLWCDSMDSFLAAGRYSDCHAFIGVVPYLRASEQQRAAEFYYRVGRAYLGTGAVAEAEALCRQLPQDSARATLLKADIEFYRCQFEAAEQTARQGLTRMTGADRERLELRLAEILLYRGSFRAAREALGPAQPGTASGSANADLARSMLTGEVALFSGHLTEAEQIFADCERKIAAAPASEQDATIVGWNRADRGLVHIVKQEWDAAFADAEAALQIREPVSHERGMANSLFLMGWARCGEGRHAEGRAYLGRAGKLARDQGDDVTLAKIWQVEAMSRFATGEIREAIELLEDAANRVKKWGAPYDLAHALLDLTTLRQADHNARGMVAALDEARQLLATHEFGLLELLYSGSTEPPVQRIRAGIVSFAAGDALGAPWEGRMPADISFAGTGQLPSRADWPVGTTTDDTDQLLAVAETVPAAAGRDLARNFLTALAAALPSMRGTGPTTPAAVAKFLRTGSVVAGHGTTNGAAVRALAVGWAVPVSRSARRRQLTEDLTKTTHDSPEALICAHLVAAMGSWAAEGVGGDVLAEVAIEELDEVRHEHMLSDAADALLRSAARGDWQRPEQGVSMQAIDTVAAVLSVIRSAPGTAAAMLTSLHLGGDTDSVAALAGGLLGSARPPDVSAIPWLSQVRLPAPERLDSLARALAAYRSGQYA